LQALRRVHRHAHGEAVVDRRVGNLTTRGSDLRLLPGKGLLGAAVRGKISREIDLSQATKEKATKQQSVEAVAETRDEAIARLAELQTNIQKQIIETDAEYKAELQQLHAKAAKVQAEFRAAVAMPKDGAGV
jgi:hypothetical protein